jgi:hypothetical protein|tara:strand:+ start:405 stop:581 length:177 start_codon:yes stop_codon:yes gene_type:complete
MLLKNGRVNLEHVPQKPDLLKANQVEQGIPVLKQHLPVAQERVFKAAAVEGDEQINVI